MLDMDKQVFIVKRFSYGYKVLICTANEILLAVAANPEYAHRVHALNDCQLTKVIPEPMCRACQELADLGLDRHNHPAPNTATQGRMAGRHRCNSNWFKIPENEVVLDNERYTVEVRYELSY